MSHFIADISAHRQKKITETKKPQESLTETKLV